MIWHIVWFILGLSVGAIGAGYLFARMRDRERAEIMETLKNCPEFWMKEDA
jgi:hypothetical protein